MEKQVFVNALLKWYAAGHRQMPWRGHADPYAIWISEAMLQQTRVETVIPYFNRWMGLFPNIETLANASEQQVLSAWEGLGYYTRARNLHKAAQVVCQNYHGELPRSAEELMHLPGIGPYTAAAIASIAFGQDEAVLDGNVKRVLSRAFNLDFPVNSPTGEKAFWQAARELVPHGKAGDYNQAVMDLGAVICTPHAPSCSQCLISQDCEANKLSLQNERPVMLAKAPVPHHLVVAAVLRQGECVLIARRPSEGLLGGMWEFPGGKVEAGETLPQALQREILEELGIEIEVGGQLGIYHHAYTHFRVTLHAFTVTHRAGTPQPLHATELQWVPIAQLPEFPMGKIDRMISKDLMK
jgi:A/G-specific adenine glycosylase